MSTLKKVLIASPVMILLALGVALAQMGSGGHNHGESGDHGGTMPSSQMNMMADMSHRHDQMMTAYNDLDQHLQDMMLVSDMQMLRHRLVEHQALMRQMRDHMVAQQNGWQQMMPSTAHSQPSPNEVTRTGRDRNTGSRTGCGH